MYLFSVLAFARLRRGFGGLMFCSDLSQCFVTVLRFGLIGDLFENMVPREDSPTFDSFFWMAIFHTSELRNMKWTAEVDMRDNCFICSRSNYDFEHHGQGFDYHVRNEHN
uniref:Secreted protein n=1 Tax=Macrostomum lignano TaxID=282301 RepID=A0A1I8I413_9PLAT